MKKIHFIFLGAMLIALLAAFATPRPTVTFHKRLINTANCVFTTCSNIPSFVCAENDMIYFQSSANGLIPCNTPRILFEP